MKITDFGISKRWLGTSLKTNCGTAIYRSPEQLGILPRQFRAAGNSYTNQIDIWALGVIVHEMLTLHIPFLDSYAIEDSGFTATSVEDTVDTGLLYAYCQGADPFPCGSLRSHDVSEDGIEFVKSLMAVNPSERPSAAAALASEWLVQTDSTDGPASPEPLPSKKDVEVVLATSPSSTESPATVNEAKEHVVHSPRFTGTGLSRPVTKEEKTAVRIASARENTPGPSPAASSISAPIESGNDQHQTNIQTDDSPLASPTEILSGRANDTTAQRGRPTSVKKERNLRRSGSLNSIPSYSPSPSEYDSPGSSDSSQHWESHTGYKKRSRWRLDPLRLSTSRLDLTLAVPPGPSRPNRRELSQSGSTTDDGEQRGRHIAFPDHPPRRDHRRSPASRPNRQSILAAQSASIGNAPLPTHLTADPQTTISYFTSHSDSAQNVASRQTPIQAFSNVTDRNTPSGRLSRLIAAYEGSNVPDSSPPAESPSHRIESFARADIPDPNLSRRDLSHRIQVYDVATEREVLGNIRLADPPPAGYFTAHGDPIDPPPATAFTLFGNPVRSPPRKRSNMAVDPESYSISQGDTRLSPPLESMPESHKPTRWDGFVDGLRKTFGK